MASAYGILGQSAPAATTLTDIYTVPGLTQAVISTVTVCNRDATPTSFRVSQAVGGAADSDEQYLAYDTPIAANSSYTLTLGLTLAATDVLRVYATDAQLSFNVSGVELT